MRFFRPFALVYLRMGSVGIGFGLNFFNGNLLPNIEKLISRFFSLFRSFAVFAAKKNASVFYSGSVRTAIIIFSWSPL